MAARADPFLTDVEANSHVAEVVVAVEAYQVPDYKATASLVDAARREHMALLSAAARSKRRVTRGSKRLHETREFLQKNQASVNRCLRQVSQEVAVLIFAPWSCYARTFDMLCNVCFNALPTSRMDVECECFTGFREVALVIAFALPPQGRFAWTWLEAWGVFASQ